MRYGQYYLRVGSGQQRAFYLFESETARNIEARKRAREISTTKTFEELVADREIEIGLNTENAAVYKEIRGSSQMLRDIFGLIDDSNRAGSSAPLNNAEALKDSIYQMYLMTLPEADIRRRFAHRTVMTLCVTL